MTTNLVPISSDGGFITAGNITTASYASPAPTLSGFSSVSATIFTNGDSNVTINSNANIILSAPASFNICTITAGGSGYNTGSSLKATTGGSGTGMTVGIGYGLSNQLTSVTVVDPGTGYVNGDVITVSEGTGGTFVITKYNVLANQTNDNTVQANITIINNTLTLPTYGEIIVPGNVTAGNLVGPLANGNSNVRIATSNGNVTVTSSGTNTWTFDSTGNLTLPTGGNISATGNITANYFLGNGSQLTNLPAPTVSQDITSTGAMSIMTYDGNLKYVNYATVEPVTGNIAGGNISTSGIVTATGNITGGNISTTGNISGNTNGFAIGYLNIPQVAASNTTIALTDAGKHYYSTSAGNFTLTIPNNATTSFATGTAISIVVQSAGNVLVNAASSVTLYMAGNSTAANRVVGGYGMATLMKVATDTWFINGTGVS